MANSNEHMRIYMSARYHSRRIKAIESLGGKCALCESIEDLEIDHIDKKLKSFSIGARLASCPVGVYQAELAKCQVLCHDCHKEKSDREQSVEHGGGVSGKKNCLCDLCREKKREYTKEWRRVNGRRKKRQFSLDEL